MTTKERIMLATAKTALTLLISAIALFALALSVWLWLSFITTVWPYNAITVVALTVVSTFYIHWKETK